MTDPLLHSIGLYQDILARTLDIEAALEVIDPDTIHRLSGEIAGLLAKARTTDEELSKALVNGTIAAGTELFDQRAVLMKQILDKNNLLAPRIAGIRALKQDELRTVRHGRRTVHGYARPTDKAGRIINTAR